MTTKKTIQVAYLESPKSRKWMLKNVPKQGQSKFIRDAVADRIQKSVPRPSK